MYKFYERGISKSFLIQIPEKQIEAIAEREHMRHDTFVSNYLYEGGKTYFAVLEAFFGHTLHSRPPEDGKLRKLKPAYNWLKLNEELLHPKMNILDAMPIPYNWTYSATE